MKAEQRLELHLKDDEFMQLLREALIAKRKNVNLAEYPEGPLIYHESDVHQWRLVFYGKELEVGKSG